MIGTSVMKKLTPTDSCVEHSLIGQSDEEDEFENNR